MLIHRRLAELLRSKEPVSPTIIAGLKAALGAPLACARAARALIHFRVCADHVATQPGKGSDAVVFPRKVMEAMDRAADYLAGVPTVEEAALARDAETQAKGACRGAQLRPAAIS